MKKLAMFFLFFVLFVSFGTQRAEAVGYTNDVRNIPKYATWAVEDLNYGIFYYGNVDGYLYSARDINEIPDNAQWVLSSSQYSNFYFRAQNGTLNFITNTLEIPRGMYWIFRSSVHSGIYYATPDGTVIQGGAISDIPLNAKWVIPGSGVGNFYYGGTPPSTPPNVPVFTYITSNQILTFTNPTLNWSFTDPDSGDYQTAYQIVGSKDGFANWHYNSGEVVSANTWHSMPVLGDGNWSFAVRTRDSQGNWSADWGYLWNVKLDTTVPTYTTHTPTDKKMNATAFRLEVNGVSDALSGVKRVMVGTWTDAEGVGNAKWQDFVHTGAGSWYTDISISNHNNYEGNYYSNVYIIDEANNQVMIPTIKTVIDRTPPQITAYSIEGANFVNGNDYWVKPGQTFSTHVSGKDSTSGLKGLYHVFSIRDQLTKGVWIHYDVVNNTGGDFEANAGSYIPFTRSSFTKTSGSGGEIKTTLTMAVQPTNSIHFYDFNYNLHDNATNQTNDVFTGKRVIIDGQAPTGNITSNHLTLTNEDVRLTAIGADGVGSGVKRIQLPNGSYVSGSSATYDVSANGTYTFTFEDNVGNVTMESIIVSNIDKLAPTITYTPEFRDADLTDIEVQTNITDTGGSGYKATRYVWTKDETYPTEGWSDWDAVLNPLIRQNAPGKWVLHIEALDNVGNVGYVFSGLYEKIALSGGPSVNINVFPLPTGRWGDKPIDVYIMDSGDSELLAKAKKYYEVTNSPLYPNHFSGSIPLDKKVPLTLQGENFIHVQYILDDGTKISSTSGPYLIDSGNVADFEMKLVNTTGVEVTTWTNQPLNLIMNDPIASSISGTIKQYRVEGIHTEWQTYQSDTVIAIEGNYRIYGRVLNGAGVSSQQKIVTLQVDKTTPKISQLVLQLNEDGTYDVTVNAVDELSGIKEVLLNNGTKLTQNNKTFVAKGLTAKPVSVSSVDLSGNVSSELFEVEPIISFQSPYTFEEANYREDVVVEFSNTTKYFVGKQEFRCETERCSVVIQKNTTLTAINESGIKETKKVVSIENLNKSPLSFILSGKRNLLTPTQVEFEWNYPLTSGHLVCTENGTEKRYPVTGTTGNFIGKNAVYECFVQGVYRGENVKSNRVMIFADTNLTIDGDEIIEEMVKHHNIHLDENATGNSYLINAKSDNYKLEKFPFPKEIF